MTTLEELKAIEAKAQKEYEKAAHAVTDYERNVERPALLEKYAGKCFMFTEKGGDFRYSFYTLVLSLDERNDPICFRIESTTYKGKPHSVSIDHRHNTYVHYLGTPITRAKFEAAYRKALEQIAIPNVGAK